MYFGHVALEGNVGIWVQCRNASDVPSAPDAAPNLSVYEEGSSTALATDASMTGPVDSKTGFYRESVACTAAAGFESGKTYSVLIEYAISATSYSAVGTFTVV